MTLELLRTGQRAWTYTVNGKPYPYSYRSQRAARLAMEAYRKRHA